MLQRTYTMKKDEIQRTWWVVDAAGKPVGRVAAQVARLLQGKHKPTYTPHMDMGDHVIILNAEKAILQATSWRKCCTTTRCTPAGCAPTHDAN